MGARITIGTEAHTKKNVYKVIRNWYSRQHLLKSMPQNNNSDMVIKYELSQSGKLYVLSAVFLRDICVKNCWVCVSYFYPGQNSFISRILITKRYGNLEKIEDN